MAGYGSAQPPNLSRSVSVTGDANLKTKVEKLEKAQAAMKELLENDNKFNNDCEEVFSEYRRACVHLRKDLEVLDYVEDKVTPVRFMFKFCKWRPPYHNRCEEVLKILLQVDAFREAFVAEGNFDDLPPAIANELKSAEVVAPSGAALVTVVQRCSRAQVLVDADAGTWTQVGRGLLVCISFGDTASDEKVRLLARSLLTAPLSGVSPIAESVATLCKRGKAQGILLVPQASLSAQLEAGQEDVVYEKTCEEEAWKKLHSSLADALKAIAAELTSGEAGACLPKIVSASHCGPCQSWEVTSDGLMHTFSF